MGESARTNEKVSFRSAPGPILLGVGLLALFALTSAGFAVQGVQDLRDARRSAGWPSTRGVVISASIKPSSVPLSIGTAAIRYRYSVGDRTYESTRVAFSRVDGTLDLVRRYRTGSEVAVHYDAERPAVAVLESGGSLLSLSAEFYVAIASLLATLGGLGWIVPKISWTQ
ncbi:MAG: DUF3592 domain-containing protein [Myxococcota bacterium]